MSGGGDIITSDTKMLRSRKLLGFVCTHCTTVVPPDGLHLGVSTYSIKLTPRLCLPISCLETSFLCVCGHCLCCRKPDYLLVDCRRVHWGMGFVRPAGEGGTWQAVGTGTVTSLVLTLTNRLAFPAKSLAFFMWPITWKIWVNYEKDLRKKR